MSSKDVIIDISVVGDEVHYTHFRAFVQHGDTLIWRFDHPFAVHFSWDALPWQGETYKKLTSPYQIQLPVMENAEFGSFKYTVALMVGDDIIMDDPEIIVKK